MLQLYFLSIVCNGLAGYILFAGNEKDMGEKGGFPVKNPTFYLIWGIVCAVVGVLKLLSPAPKLDFTPGVIIVGDLLPALGGLFAGFLFIFGIFRQNKISKSAELDRVGSNLLALRKPIGIGIMTISLLHFLFGQLIFL
jgi:hypothetical protein